MSAITDPWIPRGLLGPPVATSSTGPVSADTVIGFATRGVIVGRWYRIELIVFDANTTVAGDRFTFTPQAGANSLQSITLAFPNTAVATTPVPPVIGWWQADATGSVAFSVHVVRAAGTGTIDVNSGQLTVSDWGLGT
jgi:hypothetical protein